MREASRYAVSADGRWLAIDDIMASISDHRHTLPEFAMLVQIVAALTSFICCCIKGGSS